MTVLFPYILLISNGTHRWQAYLGKKSCGQVVGTKDCRNWGLNWSVSVAGYNAGPERIVKLTENLISKFFVVTTDAQENCFKKEF